MSHRRHEASTALLLLDLTIVAMQRPTFLQPRSDGRFVTNQLRSARGLRERIRKLKNSWANDSVQLETQQQELNERFDQLDLRANEKESLEKHESVEAWDLELDHKITLVERELLFSVRDEKGALKRLQLAFVESKQALKKRRESDIADAKSKLDNGKQAALQLRDSIKKKLERERRNLNLTEDDLSEWLITTVGQPFRQSDVKLSSEARESILQINDLGNLSKSIEEEKGQLGEVIAATKALAGRKGYSPLVLVGIGTLLSLIASGVAWGMEVPLIFVILIAIVGAIVLSASLYFVTRPLLARSVQRFAPDFQLTLLGLHERIQQGVRIAESQCQNEIQRLENEHRVTLERIESRYLVDREELQAKLDADTEALRKNMQLRRWELTNSRRSSFEAIDKKWEPILQQKLKSFGQQRNERNQLRKKGIQEIADRFQLSQRYCSERWQVGAEGIDEAMRNANAFFQETQPDWTDRIYSSGEWKRDAQNLIWQLGTSPIQTAYSDEASECSERLRIESEAWPVVFDLLYHGALVLHGNADADTTIDGILNGLILRSITSLPEGSMRVTMIDPQGLGKKYSWLMALADVDPALVGDRVWTQPLHIADQLSTLARTCEDIIQQSLRNNYKNLYEYNQEAGPMALPYRLIVWDQFPAGLDDNSWQSLCSILAAGGRCGVGVVLRLSDTHIWPSFADPQKLEEFGLHLTFPPGTPPNQAAWEVGEFQHAPIQLKPPPTSEQLKEVMGHHLEQVSELGRVIVPFESIAVPTSERQQADSADSLTVPIGIAASGRPHAMKLGYGTAQHLLIAGKTGSGKSSLLHTMITSAALKYSPDELRLILLDFKKGVEFQVYAEAGLPHADVIGIESKREFGVSTLEYIDRVMHARGEAFRNWGVQDLPSLSRKHPEVRMPRLLIIIDEFQELFVEDDKLSQQASMLMDRIVRQGRSFGIHLVLASQTLGGAYSLPRTTLAQMAVRIALQCDSSDAMLILGEDNTVAERLRFSGQAIYNDAGGRIESNQGFQVAYVDKETQLHELKEIPFHEVLNDPTINPMGRRVVFEGHKPAVWDDATMGRLLDSDNGSKETALPLLLGDSVSIDPPVVRWLPKAAGRNVCVVGPEERTAASILAGTLQGALRLEGSSGEDVHVVLLDGTRSEDATLTSVVERASHLPRCEIGGGRDIESRFAAWKEELEKRLESPQENYPPLLICILNLARFRELRKGDEFSFGDSAGGAQPDAVLSDLLRDGPTVGIHVWIWADSVGTLGRWLSRQSLRDLELRILMQMSANDSNQLIDSNAANKLEPHVVLFQDEMEGKPVKFRPFAWESLPLMK